MTHNCHVCEGTSKVWNWNTELEKEHVWRGSCATGERSGIEQTPPITSGLVDKLQTQKVPLANKLTHELAAQVHEHLIKIEMFVKRKKETARRVFFPKPHWTKGSKSTTSSRSPVSIPTLHTETWLGGWGLSFHTSSRGYRMFCILSVV